jgi:hypothetical protein
MGGYCCGKAERTPLFVRNRRIWVVAEFTILKRLYIEEHGYSDGGQRLCHQGWRRTYNYGVTVYAGKLLLDNGHKCKHRRGQVVTPLYTDGRTYGLESLKVGQPLKTCLRSILSNLKLIVEWDDELNDERLLQEEIDTQITTRHQMLSCFVKHAPLPMELCEIVDSYAHLQPEVDRFELLLSID